MLTYNRMVVGGSESERADALFHALADPTRRDILSVVLQDARSVSDLARQYPISFAAVHKHVAALERAGLVTKTRHGREQRVRGDAATCGPPIACSTTSRRCGAGGSAASSRCSRAGEGRTAMTVIDVVKDAEAQDHDHHRALRRADRPRLGGVERSAPARALVGAADVSRDDDGARPRAGRQRRLLDDRPRRRAAPRLVARARGRPAAHAGVRGRRGRRRRQPEPGHPRVGDPRRPFRARRRRYGDGDDHGVGQRRGDGVVPRLGHGRRHDRRRRPDRRAARPGDRPHPRGTT